MTLVKHMITEKFASNITINGLKNVCTTEP